MSTPSTPTFDALLALMREVHAPKVVVLRGFWVPPALRERIRAICDETTDSPERDALLSYLLTLGLDAYERQRAERDEATP